MPLQYYTIQIHHEELPYTDLTYTTAILHNSKTPRDTLYSLYRVNLYYCNTTQFKDTTQRYPILPMPSYPILLQYYTIQGHHEELPYAPYTELPYTTAILHNSRTPRRVTLYHCNTTQFKYTTKSHPMLHIKSYPIPLQYYSI